MAWRNEHVICFVCICTLIFIISPVIILITLSYVGLEPRFYIQNLYVPAINSSIFIDLKFKRVVAYVPLRYEDINITLFYASNRSFPVARHVVPGFYQGMKMTVYRRAVVEASPIPGGSAVTLAVELNTKYMLKRDNGNGWYYENPKAVVVAADVQLDVSGNKASKKPLRLH